MNIEEIVQKQKWEEKFDMLSDSILYMNGYSKEEILAMYDVQKILELQKLDKGNEC